MGLLHRCVNCAQPRERCLARRRQHREVPARGTGYPEGLTVERTRRLQLCSLADESQHTEGSAP